MIYNMLRGTRLSITTTVPSSLELSDPTGEVLATGGAIDLFIPVRGSYILRAVANSGAGQLTLRGARCVVNDADPPPPPTGVAQGAEPLCPPTPESDARVAFRPTALSSAEGMVGWPDGSFAIVINQPIERTARVHWFTSAGVLSDIWQSPTPIYLRTISAMGTDSREVVAVGSTGGAGRAADAVVCLRISPTEGELWSATVSTSEGFDYGYAVSANEDATRVLVGGFNEGGLVGSPAGGLDNFYRVLDAESGNTLHTNQFAGPGEDRLFNAVAAPGSGWILSGDTSSSPLFNLATPDEIGGERDIFLCRVADDGTLEHGVQLGSAADDLAFDCRSDSGGRIYLTGQTRGAFEPAAGPPSSLAIYLLVMEPDLTLAWRRQFGRPEGGFAETLCLDTQSRPVVLFANQGQIPGFTQSDLRPRSSEDATLFRFSRSGVLEQALQLDDTTERIYPRALTITDDRVRILRDRAAIPDGAFLESDVIEFTWAPCIDAPTGTVWMVR